MIFIKEGPPTHLCELGYKYGTDKTPLIALHYTRLYFKLFHERRTEIRKVLEMGIGYKDVMPVDKFQEPRYHGGGSLRMWREFFPNAQIYGADIAPQTMFTEERIQTYLCDERKREDLERLISQTGSDLDIFIDDASHQTYDQIGLVTTLMPMLDKGVTYVMEDVHEPEKVKPALDGYRFEQVRFQHKRFSSERIILVWHK